MLAGVRRIEKVITQSSRFFAKSHRVGRSALIYPSFSNYRYFHSGRFFSTQCNGFLSSTNLFRRWITNEVIDEDIDNTNVLYEGEDVRKHFAMLKRITALNGRYGGTLEAIIEQNTQIPLNVWDECIYSLFLDNQKERVLKVYNHLSAQDLFQDVKPLSVRCFLQSAAEVRDYAAFKEIWEKCNELKWKNKDDFYTVHGVYIYGLLVFHHIPEALKEYQLYNRYQFLNSRVNTFVLSGFLDAGLPADCLILFVTLLLDVRFNFDPNNVVTINGEELVNWTQNLTDAKPGCLVADEGRTFFDDATKQRLFGSIDTNSAEENAADQPIQNDIRKYSKDRWVPFTIPGYECAVKAACKLKNLQYAMMIYKVIKANTRYCGTQLFYSLISYIGESDWKKFSNQCIESIENLHKIPLTEEDKARIQSNFLLRLPVLSEKLFRDYERLFGSFVKRFEDSSTLRVDLSTIPEYVALPFLLFSIISTVNLVKSDFMWLRGTLALKVHNTEASYLEILKTGLFPAIEYERRDNTVTIPIINIHQWYENHQTFSDPEIPRILSVYKCDFDLDAGKDNEVFQFIHAVERISRHEVREFTVPEKHVVNQGIMALKLKKAEEEEKRRREATISLQEKLKLIGM